MPKVAILIAASPAPAFYSQVAALALCLRRLTWSRWQPSVHMYLGGERDADAYGRWLPHLRDVEISWVSEARFAREGDWAQSDDAFRFAPRDADVLLAMDADTLPVASLEDLLDRVLESEAIAGVIAHYPTVLSPDTPYSHQSLRDAWTRLAEGIVETPLDFTHSHTLMGPDAPPEQRLTPFYLNFGVVAFPKSTFDEVAGRYLTIRPAIMERMPAGDFSGQAALTLAIAAAGARTLSLPMRFNFPNDPRAAEMYPEELARAVVFHYLRTTSYDRHQIFAAADQYRAFLDLRLVGVDRTFQQAVRSMVGADYPFVPSRAAIARST